MSWARETVVFVWRCNCVSEPGLPAGCVDAGEAGEPSAACALVSAKLSSFPRASRLD